jgi:hypothetical protein
METATRSDIGAADFYADPHAAKYQGELEAHPDAFQNLFELLNFNEQRLTDAEMHNLPALAGVVRFIEADPAIERILISGGLSSVCGRRRAQDGEAGLAFQNLFELLNLPAKAKETAHRRRDAQPARSRGPRTSRQSRTIRTPAQPQVTTMRPVHSQRSTPSARSASTANGSRPVGRSWMRWLRRADPRVDPSSVLIILDSGPLGLVSNPSTKGHQRACPRCPNVGTNPYRRRRPPHRGRNL